jgi:hypothetical protein
MSYAFVDNAAVNDRATRRRIRSHVAKGRNTGKTIVRPSRVKAFGLKARIIQTPVGTSNFVQDVNDVEGCKEMLPEIERQVGDGLSVLSFPEQLTPGSTRLVQRGTYNKFE